MVTPSDSDAIFAVIYWRLIRSVLINLAMVYLWTIKLNLSTF
jgi:hypothetical protein